MLPCWQGCTTLVCLPGDRLDLLPGDSSDDTACSASGFPLALLLAIAVLQAGQSGGGSASKDVVIGAVVGGVVGGIVLLATLILFGIQIRRCAVVQAVVWYLCGTIVT